MCQNYGTGLLIKIHKSHMEHLLKIDNVICKWKEKLDYFKTESEIYTTVNPRLEVDLLI